MQIHELNTFGGSLDSSAFVAVDNGTDTGKTSIERILDPVNERIDNIIGGGDAPSEAEILDARHGENGRNYSSLGDAIRDQFRLIKTDTKMITGVEIISFSSGYIYSDVYSADLDNPRPSSSGTLQYAIVPCSEGDAFVVSGRSYSSNPMAWIFAEEDGTVISRESPNVTITDKALIAPAGAELLIINRVWDQADSFKGVFINDKIESAPVKYSNFMGILRDSFRVNSYSDSYAPPMNNSDYLLAAGTGELEAYAGSIVSDLIDCSGWGAFQFTGKSYYAAACIAFYSQAGACLQTYPADGDASSVTYTNEVISVPRGVKYVRFGDNRNSVGGQFKVKPGTTVAPIDSALAWAGKKWAAVGDSLTEANLRTTMNYHDYIAQLTGINVVNLGHSGSGYKRSFDDGHAFYQMVSNVPIDSDVVTIFGSGNDMTYVASSLGDVTDTGTTTLCGCINTTIDNLYAIMPTVHLGIITPCPWEDYPPSDLTNPMLRYSEKIIEICKRRGIPCLDLYHCSNLRPWDATFRSLAYSKDGGNGVHPDETGHKLIAGMIKSFLGELFI